MNWFERQAFKIAWGRVEGKMPKVKRYLPLIGTFILVVTTLLRTFGFGAAADGISQAGNLIGALPPEVTTEFMAAVAAAIGLGIKTFNILKHPPAKS